MRAVIKTSLYTILFLFITLCTIEVYSIEQSTAQNSKSVYDAEKILDESIRKELKEEPQQLKQENGMHTAVTSIILMLDQLKYFNYIPSQTALINAIKMYQADLEEPQTGILTKSQLDQLFKRSNKIEASHRILITDQNSIIENLGNIIFASGTLKILDEHEYIWNPLNITNIECIKEYKLCIMTQISISDSFSEFMGSYSMESIRTIFKITNWGENEINAVNEESLCRIEDLKINTNDRTAYIITSNKNIELESCNVIGKLVKPQISQLVPGLKESQEYWDRENKKKSKYYNSRYKNHLKILFQEFAN